MKLRLLDGLLFAPARIRAGDQHVLLEHVIIDTGSARTLFSTSALESAGLTAAKSDNVRRVRGVGGYEFVLTKQLDEVRVGELAVGPFEVQMGGMEYGFRLDGIIGLDFLMSVGAVIDLSRLELWAVR